ncbi:MAG TPA: iron-containing redox enzyme family protein [Solirubrobacteraceae bacterium]
MAATTTDRPQRDSFDAEIAQALETPELASALQDDPERRDAILERGRALALHAFEEEADAALDVAHRTLYIFAAQSGWSPVGVARENEHDLTLAAVRLCLESAFEQQLARVADVSESPPQDASDALNWLTDLALKRPLFDGPSMGDFYREKATLEQLREVVAQRSLFFLKEPDPWAMVIPSLRGAAKAGLIDLILDEYGWGRHDQMHSTVYAKLMEKLGLSTGYDDYFDQTSWQLLAGLNYQAMLARQRRLCRRMYGYIYLVEADSPSSMRNYLEAYARAGVEDPEILLFYQLHIDADVGHADVALNEVVAPVLRSEPAAAGEIARGIVEGRYLHSLFARHLHNRFSANRSSLRRGTL